MAVYIGFQDRLNHLIGLVQQYAPFINSDFWDSVKSNDELNILHHNTIYEECDLSAQTLFNHLKNHISNSLSDIKAAELFERSDTYKLHCEVIQASMLEPHEEAAQWDIWEREDARSAVDERYEMYRNEY